LAWRKSGGARRSLGWIPFKVRTGPKGRKDLGIRGWQCPVCEAIHDRDVNAAHNILAAGHRHLAEGILVP
jgi:hypothetical protein